MNNNNNIGWLIFGGYKNMLPSMLTILPSSSTRAILLTSLAIYSYIPLKAIQYYINSTRCKDVFNNTTFVNSKRQNQALKSILVRASFQNSKLHKPTISKCGKSRCGCCNNNLEQSSLYFQNADKFEIKTNMNCSSQNLIYALICGNCKKTYIGETGGVLRYRVRVHRQQIDNPS